MGRPVSGLAVGSMDVRLVLGTQNLFCDRTELASGDRSEATSVNAAKLAGSLFSAAIVRCAPEVLELV